MWQEIVMAKHCGIQNFPDGGGGAPTYYLAKLHGNERNWTEGAHAPPDPQVPLQIATTDCYNKSEQDKLHF